MNKNIKVLLFTLLVLVFFTIFSFITFFEKLVSEIGSKPSPSIILNSELSNNEIIECLHSNRSVIYNDLFNLEGKADKLGNDDYIYVILQEISLIVEIRFYYDMYSSVERTWRTNEQFQLYYTSQLEEREKETLNSILDSIVKKCTPDAPSLSGSR